MSNININFNRPYQNNHNIAPLNTDKQQKNLFVLNNAQNNAQNLQNSGLEDIKDEIQNQTLSDVVLDAFEDLFGGLINSLEKNQTK